MRNTEFTNMLRKLLADEFADNPNQTIGFYEKNMPERMAKIKGLKNFNSIVQFQFVLTTLLKISLRNSYQLILLLKNHGKKQ